MFPIPRKYKARFVDGISTPQSYLMLKSWKGRNGESYHAAIQPHVYRKTDYTVQAGGKLRIRLDAGTGDHEALVGSKFEDIKFDVADDRRARVFFLKNYRANVQSKEALFEDDHVAREIIAGIEELLGTKIDDKAITVAALHEALQMNSGDTFHEPMGS